MTVVLFILAKASDCSVSRYALAGDLSQEAFFGNLMGWRKDDGLGLWGFHQPAEITLDVCIPTWRLDVGKLEGILKLRCSDPRVHVRFLIQIDRDSSRVSHETMALVSFVRG